MKTSERYILIVDTDSYSGNFEREMIAYATGLYCIRGERETQDFHDTFGEEKSWEIAEYAMEVRDENDDDRRPEYAHIWPTPGVYNNGLGFHFYDGEEEEAVEEYKKSCLVDAEKMKKVYAHMPDYIEEAAKTYLDRAAAMNLDTLRKFPAYQSVALTFRKLPPKELLNLIMNRVMDYASLPDARTGKRIYVQGFRMIKRTATVTDEEIVV